jgi:hypothetical protein
LHAGVVTHDPSHCLTDALISRSRDRTRVHDDELGILRRRLDRTARVEIARDRQ